MRASSVAPLDRCVIAAAALLVAGPALAQHPEPVIFAPGTISAGANELSPAFTPDGRTVVFTRSAGSQLILMISHRTANGWSRGEVAPFSGEWRDLEPAMSPDGSYIVFISNRPVTPGGKPLDAFYNKAARPALGGNLWRVDRTRTGWSTPRRLPDVINTNTSIFSPAVTADGSIYFMQPVGDAKRFHLFRSQLTHGTFATPVPVAIATTDSIGDFDPAVAPDESFMIFSSSGRPGAKSTALYISFRRNGTWSDPLDMGPAVNDSTGVIEARLSPDLSTLYYTSRRITAVTMPRSHADAIRDADRMVSWDNGLANIWSVPLASWLARQ